MMTVALSGSSWEAADPAGHRLPDVPVAELTPEMLVPLDDLLAYVDHLVQRQAGVDPSVLQRPVQTLDVLFHPEALAAERPRYVEDRVTHPEATVG